jgi:asparagine synthase (glutamine-hydrolysing)
MSQFAGIVAFDGSDCGHRFEDQVRKLVGRRHAQALRTAGAVFVLDESSPERRKAHAVEKLSGGTLFAADCSLDNRSELCAALGIPPRELAAVSDGMVVFLAYQRWGEAGLAKCLGAFACALWDPATRRLVLARDCLGNRTLFFHQDCGILTFATSLRGLLALPNVPREIDEIALADLLALNFAEPCRTFYRGIERVPSRSAVTIDHAGVRRQTYWSPDLCAPAPYRREEDYIARARELFDQAVIKATADTARVAISTSGGLDSSAIAATVARLGRAERITCYTLTPPPEIDIDLPPGRYLDERGKVESLGRMHPALGLRFLTDETSHRFEQNAVAFFARTNLPVLGPANLGAFAHLRDAAAGDQHSTLLVGKAGNYGLSWDGLFSLSSLLCKGYWRTFAHELFALARQDRRGLMRAIGGGIVMPIASPNLLRLIHRFRGRDPDSVAWFSSLNPAFVAEHKLPQRWHAQCFDPWFFARPSSSPAHFRAYYLFDYNQYARDLVAASRVLNGLETRDPHADRPLLEFLLLVPEWMYRQNGVSRSFARKVFADRLPPEILNETRRGAQGVNWFQRMDARRQSLAEEVEGLEASPLANRLLDVPRMKRILDDWPKDAQEAEIRTREVRLAFARGVHVGQFIRWVEGGNA